MSPQARFRIILTCEHGGNDVPPELLAAFDSPDARRQLQSHRGYDPGALDIARYLSQALNASLLVSTVSRLVVELNRSLDSPQLFSKFTCGLAPAMQQHLIARYYEPHRRAVHDAISNAVALGEAVVHLSIHSFTPRFRGSRREFDIGILFDPSRVWESRISESLLGHLRAAGFRAEPNQPYLGTDDGLTTHLRTVFADQDYAGIEIELNNRIAKLADKTRHRWCQHLVEAIPRTLEVTGNQVRRAML